MCESEDILLLWLGEQEYLGFSIPLVCFCVHCQRASPTKIICAVCMYHSINGLSVMVMIAIDILCIINMGYSSPNSIG